MINKTVDALKYLSANQDGNLRELRDKVSVEQIVKIRDSGFLKFDKENKYHFTQEGIDYYSREYGSLEKKNFLGL